AYQPFELHDDVQWMDEPALEGIPGGVGHGGTQWIDLDGEGLPGALAPDAAGWYYKPNLGGGQLAAPVRLPSLPRPAALGVQVLSDIDGDGRLELVSYGPALAGWSSRTAEDGWDPLVAFPRLPAIDWHDPQLRFIDLDGDGHADVIISEHDAFVWYRSLARDGFASAAEVVRPHDEDAGPGIVFADARETIVVADMTGDGLADLVRIRNGEVCYWPNLGYGRFGRKVTLDGAPRFE